MPSECFVIPADCDVESCKATMYAKINRSSGWVQFASEIPDAFWILPQLCSTVINLLSISAEDSATNAKKGQRNLAGQGIPYCTARSLHKVNSCTLLGAMD